MYVKMSVTHRHAYFGQGYIAGMGDGIVTKGGTPAICPIWLFVWRDNAPTLVARTFSNERGQYLFANLDATKKYFIVARDHKGEYEPVCYDNVSPASDLTADEIRGLWEGMASG